MKSSRLLLSPKRYLVPLWPVVWIAALLTVAPTARSDDWPQWRGPGGSGHSRERGIPVRWSPTENVVWKVDLPGPGMSSPIVWRDRVILTQSLDREGRQRAILCFDRRNGREIWRHVTEFTGKESTYDAEKHYCSATPVTDGQRIVASFGSAGIVCVSMDGKPLWSRGLGPCEQIWGTAASPIIYKDLVIHNFGPGERTFLIALDKRTGRHVWKIDMPGKFGTAPADWMGSWSTPLISRRGSRDELIMSWPHEIRGYDPTTGKQLWSARGIGPLVYTSPVATEEMIIVLSGFGGPALALKRGDAGDLTESHRLWREERVPQRIGSGLIVGDHLYRVNENGVAECVVARTGQVIWSERATGTTWSSLVHADGRLYLCSQRGETVVLAAAPKFEVLARNMLNERMQSSPAVSNGSLYLRTYERLWRIGARKPDDTRNAN